jgi:hypothetical protein
LEKLVLTHAIIKAGDGNWAGVSRAMRFSLSPCFRTSSTLIVRCMVPTSVHVFLDLSLVRKAKNTRSTT